MNISTQQLAAACDCGIMRAQNWTQAINDTLKQFAVDTPVRAAAFLAQVAHESNRLIYTRELWGPTGAQLGYEGRRDLGNVQPGDGFRFLGRGLLQITGRANYCAMRDKLRSLMPGVPDFETAPTALEVPRWAAMSAGAFWNTHKLNDLADAGAFEQLTRRINGGLNGIEDRLALWERARNALGT